MVGLDAVKEQYTDLISHASLVAAARARGERLPGGETANFNTVFAGNPGTGKTTVAQAMAQAYGALGLTNGNFVEFKPSDVIGSFVGDSTEKIKAVLKAGKGGVIFIDEAHDLAASKYGREEVIPALIPFITENPNTVVIMAGYANKLPQLQEINPGFARRFPHQIDFADYNTDDLMEVARRKAKSLGLTLKLSDAQLRSAIGSVAPGTNAGGVTNLLERAQRKAKARFLATNDPHDPNVPLAPVGVLTAQDFT